jgi:hypothetical protein
MSPIREKPSLIYNSKNLGAGTGGADFVRLEKGSVQLEEQSCLISFISSSEQNLTCPELGLEVSICVVSLVLAAAGEAILFLLLFALDSGSNALFLVISVEKG